MRFVFASFAGRREASRAVGALVDHSFDPKTIQVVCHRPGKVERLPLRRKYPMLPAAMIGGGVGLVAGLAFSMARAGAVAPSLATMVGGALLGMLGGVLLTSSHFRTEPEYPRDLIDRDGIVVGVEAAGRPRARTARQALDTADAAQTYVAYDQAPEDAAYVLMTKGAHSGAVEPVATRGPGQPPSGVAGSHLSDPEVH